MERHGLALPQLDPELLCMIWKHLDLETFRNPQHALRCTCKALRDVSNAWISSAEISAGGRVYLSYHEDDVLPAECALAQLGRFPKSAVLRSLAWSCEVEMVDDDDEESPQQALMLHALQLSLDVLPSFLFQARDRLTCLTSFTWSRQVSVAVHVLTRTRAHGGEKLLAGGVLAAAFRVQDAPCFSCLGCQLFGQC